MANYSQTNAAILNAAAQGPLKARALFREIDNYLSTRAWWIGLPYQSLFKQAGANPGNDATPQQKARANRVNAITNFVLPTVNMTFRQRLAAYGPNAALDMASNGTWLAEITANANTAITNLGGAAAIDPNDCWAFLLLFIPVTSAKGVTPVTYGAFALPSIPFQYQPADVSINGVATTPPAITVDVVPVNGTDTSLLQPTYTVNGQTVSDPF